jgi:hypothetical protein
MIGPRAPSSCSRRFAPEGGRSVGRPCYCGTAFGFFKSEPILDERMDGLTALGALIALFSICAIVVWIYATRT